jgi:putative oxidoreductase
MALSFNKIQTKIAQFGSRLQPSLLLLIRLFWGWSFLVTGAGKFMHFKKVALYFSTLGIPLPTLSALLTACVETIGGCLLILGLASRIICLPLIFIMIMAFLTAESDALRMIFSNPQNFIHRDPFSFLFASILLFVFGPGRFSCDRLIAGREQEF